MRRTIERLRQRMGRTNRIVVVGVLVFGLLLGLFSALLSLDVVTIMDSNGQSQVVLTGNRAAEEILQLAGVETTAADEVIYIENPMQGTNIMVNRAFPVTVLADGYQYVTDMVEGTVADALKVCNVALDNDDYVEPGMEAALRRDMRIEVNRVDYAEITQRMEVPNEAVEAYQQSHEGEFTVSKSRIYDATVIYTLINGEIAEAEYLSLQAVYHPYDDPSSGFEPGVPVSTIDAFIGIDIENGVPTSYNYVIEGAVCTAYSASAGKGAGGQGLYCGTVAVNPNKIPYGTRLYITAADGSFVYGYAIASDCGTAMMEGYVDFDLYFESNAECRRFGKRGLTVYVLD